MSELNPGGSVPPGSDNLEEAVARYRGSGSHWRRYELAGQRLEGRDLLDLGCGHGLGAAIVGDADVRYVGVDPDAEAIAWARRVVMPERPRSRFLSVDEVAIALGDRRFGLVTCFEVLEHTEHPEELLRSAMERLAEGGALLLSTPNGAVSEGDPRRYRSPFHLREYTVDEVDRMVRRAGGQPRFYQERRRDRLDALALRLGYGAEPVRSSGGTGARIFAAFARRFDGPAYWRILPSEARAMRGRSYSTIVAEVTRATPGAEGPSEK